MRSGVSGDLQHRSGSRICGKLEILPRDVSPAPTKDVALRLFEAGVECIKPRQRFAAPTAQSGELPLLVRLDRDEDVFVLKRLPAGIRAGLLQTGAVMANRTFHEFSGEGGGLGQGPRDRSMAGA